jgi:pimeloyl-ACP methyl ester carboxylesterase
MRHGGALPREGDMNRRSFVTATIAAAAATALPKLAQADNTETMEGTAMTTTRPASGYAPVNGIELYYEIHGSGKPLVLLHGGFGSIEMFGPVLTELSKSRQVIGVDLQGHGRTLPGDRPMTFQNLATDVAGLIKWLGYDRADLMGYSMGAATALRVAIEHLAVVDRLIVASTAYAFAGWHDYNQQGMKGMAADPAAAVDGMKQTPMYQAYAQLMPDAETNWPKTIAQTAALVGADYDWSADVAKIKAPSQLVYGDWDAVRTSHVASFFELLGGGKQDANWDGSGMNQNRLAIIPGITHYTMFMDPRLATTAAAFLDG